MMKRAVSLGLFGLGTLVLFGCPIYPNDRDHRVCVDGDCYDCPDAYYSSSCAAWTCNSGGDCPSGYTCNSDHRCKFTGSEPAPPGAGTCNQPSDCAPGDNCGADNRCHSGDCSTSDCPSGFVCSLVSGSGGVPKCVRPGGGGVKSTCKNDKDCPTPAGSKCLSGSCVKPEDQCVDATQCKGSAQCVQGACTPSCSQNKPCPTGYGCDTTKGVCTQNPSPCGTTACSTGKVCVEEHCVDPCSDGGQCPAGLVCVDGGCTPDEKPQFACGTDGVQDSCAKGSLCLRHSCYIACDADAGADACKTNDTLNECKSVTTSSGQHSVCGSKTNLGTECNTAENKPCSDSTKICIDGYCK
jgi:hypothetical protein